MRPTLLNFRPPEERTAEFRRIECTHVGHKLEYQKRQVSPELLNQTSDSLKNLNIFKSLAPVYSNVMRSGSSFNRQKRFENSERYYCMLSGQSVCVGPGTYNSHENFLFQNRQSCTAQMKEGMYLNKEESKKQCYVMVGPQIKYEPAWAKTVKDYNKSGPKDASQSDLLNDLKLDHNLKSAFQALNLDNLKNNNQIDMLRKMAKARLNKSKTSNKNADRQSQKQIEEFVQYIFSTKGNPKYRQNNFFDARKSQTANQSRSRGRMKDKVNYQPTLGRQQNGRQFSPDKLITEQMGFDSKKYPEDFNCRSVQKLPFDSFDERQLNFTQSVNQPTDADSKADIEANNGGNLDANQQSPNKNALIYKMPAFSRPLTSYGGGTRNQKRSQSQLHQSAASRLAQQNTQSSSNLGGATAGGKQRNSRQNLKNRLVLSNFEMYKQGFSASSDQQQRPKTSLRNNTRPENLIEQSRTPMAQGQQSQQDFSPPRRQLLSEYRYTRQTPFQRISAQIDSHMDDLDRDSRVLYLDPLLTKNSKQRVQNFDYTLSQSSKTRCTGTGARQSNRQSMNSRNAKAYATQQFASNRYEQDQQAEASNNLQIVSNLGIQSHESQVHDLRIGAMGDIDPNEAVKQLGQELQIESGAAKPGTEPRKTKEAGDEGEAGREEPKTEEIKDAKEGQIIQQQASKELDIDVAKGANQEKVGDARLSTEPGARDGSKGSASVTSQLELATSPQNAQAENFNKRISRRKSKEDNQPAQEDVMTPKLRQATQENRVDGAGPPVPKIAVAEGKEAEQLNKEIDIIMDGMEKNKTLNEIIDGTSNGVRTPNPDAIIQKASPIEEASPSQEVKATPDKAAEPTRIVIVRAEEARSLSQTNLPTAKPAGTGLNFINKEIYRLQLPPDNKNVKKLAQKSPVPRYEDKSPIDVGRLEERDKKSAQGGRKTPKSMKSLKSILTDNSLDDRIYSPISQEVETFHNTSKIKNEKHIDTPKIVSEIEEDKSMTEPLHVPSHTGAQSKPPLFQLALDRQRTDPKNDILKRLQTQVKQSKAEVISTYKNHIMSLLGQNIVKKTRDINKRQDDDVSPDVGDKNNPGRFKIHEVKDLLNWEILNVMRNSNLRKQHVNCIQNLMSNEIITIMKRKQQQSERPTERTQQISKFGRIIGDDSQDGRKLAAGANDDKDRDASYFQNSQTAFDDTTLDLKYLDEIFDQRSFKSNVISQKNKLNINQSDFNENLTEMNLYINSKLISQASKKFISVSKQSSSSKEPSAAKIKFEFPSSKEVKQGSSGNGKDGKSTGGKNKQEISSKQYLQSSMNRSMKHNSIEKSMKSKKSSKSIKQEKSIISNKSIRVLNVKAIAEKSSDNSIKLLKSPKLAMVGKQKLHTYQNLFNIDAKEQKYEKQQTKHSHQINKETQKESIQLIQDVKKQKIKRMPTQGQKPLQVLQVPESPLKHPFISPKSGVPSKNTFYDEVIENEVVSGGMNSSAKPTSSYNQATEIVFNFNKKHNRKQDMQSGAMNQDIIAQVAYNEFSPKLPPSEEKEITHTTFKKQIVTDSNIGGHGGEDKFMQSFKSSKLSPEEKIASSSTPFSDEKIQSADKSSNTKVKPYAKSQALNHTMKLSSSDFQKNIIMRPINEEDIPKSAKEENKSKKKQNKEPKIDP